MNPYSIGPPEMNEPVLYVDVLGVIYDVLPTGPTYPVCLPLGGQLDEEAKIQLLRQDFKTQEQHIFRQYTEIEKLQEELKAEQLWIKGGRKLHEVQREEIQDLNQQIKKYQKDISSLLYGRPVDSHPGQVIDAQEKIISKLQNEVKQLKVALAITREEEVPLAASQQIISKLQNEVKGWKRRIHQWNNSAEEQYKVIEELQSEVKEWKQSAHYWTDTSRNQSDKITELQEKVRELITKPLIKSFLDLYKEIVVKRAG